MNLLTAKYLVIRIRKTQDEAVNKENEGSENSDKSPTTGNELVFVEPSTKARSRELTSTNIGFLEGSTTVPDSSWPLRIPSQEPEDLNPFISTSVYPVDSENFQRCLKL